MGIRPVCSRTNYPVCVDSRLEASEIIRRIDVHGNGQIEVEPLHTLGVAQHHASCASVAAQCAELREDRSRKEYGIRDDAAVTRRHDRRRRRSPSSDERLEDRRRNRWLIAECNHGGLTVARQCPYAGGDRAPYSVPVSIM